MLKIIWFFLKLHMRGDKAFELDHGDTLVRSKYHYYVVDHNYDYAGEVTNIDLKTGQVEYVYTSDNKKYLSVRKLVRK